MPDSMFPTDFKLLSSQDIKSQLQKGKRAELRMYVGTKEKLFLITRQYYIEGTDELEDMDICISFPLKDLGDAITKAKRHWSGR